MAKGELGAEGIKKVQDVARGLYEKVDEDGVSWMSVGGEKIDEKPMVQSRTENKVAGFWVKGWLWVPKEAVSGLED